MKRHHLWFYRGEKPTCECDMEHTYTSLETTPPLSKQDKMREYNAKYRERHSGMMTCECGATFREISRYNHLRSKGHLEWMTHQDR
jgi:hypothetical protein